MLKAKAPSPLPYLVGAIVLLTIGYFGFRPHSPSVPDVVSTSSPATAPTFPPPTSVPTGTVVDVDGSTSMVTINQNLKRAFEQRFPGTEVSTQANGSNQGIQTLLSGRIDVAAISRPLNEAETSKGLQAVEVANDAIAIVVSTNNPFNGSLTPQQVKGIFQGTIVNWSQVGGPNKMIRVINRPAVSGTHQSFRDLVLEGGNFGTTTNITTLAQDATTPMLRALSDDGIGYATAKQVVNQKTVRVVPVGDLRPNQPSYPYRRTLYYAYESPANDVVKAFLGFALSPQGQQAMEQEP
ncbi:MAG: phosphate ABC transporter substrate-binding protein [Leptolyngbyaceae cyanobacterium bins.302]|nr:phosphate ABC transporter substrate-binding protein [Leptolyngbyaceae cyanobacterium bins.302]